MIFRISQLRVLMVCLLVLSSCTKEHENIELNKGKRTSDNIKVPRRVNAIWPISGASDFDSHRDVIADGFGPRMLGGNYDFHRGIDFPKPIGTPIYASLRGGKVVRVESSQPGSTFERWGNWLVIAYPASSHPDPDHNSVFQVAYLHMSVVRVSEGDKVNIGDIIGEVGNTGVGINTEHLHFEYYDGINNGLIKKANSRNPLTLLPYTPENPIVGSQKDAQTITISLEEKIPSYDVIEIALQIIGSELMPSLNFEQRLGMDINDEDNNVYVDSDGTIISIAPSNFSAGDQSYFLNVSFENSNFTGITDYSIKITTAKGIVITY